MRRYVNRKGYVTPETVSPVVLSDDSLTIPVSMAKALLAFITKEPYRVNISNLGLSYSNEDTATGKGKKAKIEQFSVLAGCDGHTLVTFRMPFSKWPEALKGKHFERSYVDVETRCAVIRKSPVVLSFAAMVERTFPPINAVETKAYLDLSEAVCLGSAYLSRLAVVTKACGAEGAQLVAIGKGRDPVRFDVRGPNGQARVTIMPRIVTEELT